MSNSLKSPWCFWELKTLKIKHKKDKKALKLKVVKALASPPSLMECFPLVVVFDNAFWNMHNLLVTQICICAVRESVEFLFFFKFLHLKVTDGIHWVFLPFYPLTFPLFQEWMGTISDFCYLARTRWRPPAQVTFPPLVQSQWDQLKPHRCVYLEYEHIHYMHNTWKNSSRY